jgi:hypothetical protein
MSRLIAFGCSNTYGQGLPDCHFKDKKGGNLPGPHPSKHAWPEQLGKLLGATQVINKAAPGSSNKQIWNNIVNFDFLAEDFVVCHWSLLHRSCIFYPDKDLIALGLWAIPEVDIGTAYQKYVAVTDSDYNLMIESCAYIDHAHLSLKNRVKHLYHVVFRSDEFDRVPKWTSFEFITEAGYYNRRFPLALDNAHTGVQGHKELAKDIFNKHIQKLAAS